MYFPYKRFFLRLVTLPALWLGLSHLPAQSPVDLERQWEAATHLETRLELADRLHTAALQRNDYRQAHRWSREQAQLEQQQAQLSFAARLERETGLLNEELNSQKERNRLCALAGSSLAGLLLLLLWNRRRRHRRMRGELAERNALIEEKRRRSEQLLLNILPAAVAAELTVRNKVAARRYEKATVMFVDFVGFTTIAESLSPEALVQELDTCFSHFDELIGRMRIEKIKTVGDAYICASGLTDRNESPAQIIQAALSVQAFLATRAATRRAQGLPAFEARIGIHFGPVVAGVVGTKKFAYDIWGDTVNTTARLEEVCEAGRINVSGRAKSVVETLFVWEHRGKIATKNKAEMDMYYVGLPEKSNSGQEQPT